VGIPSKTADTLHEEVGDAQKNAAQMSGIPNSIKSY